MAQDRLYAGCLLGAGQLRPWGNALVHLYLRDTTRPLCGTFASGRIFELDASLTTNPRCRSCVAISRRRHSEFAG